MKLTELAERLKAYGLETSEAVVYFHLCRLGKARAASVAREASVKRTDVYRILEQLERKGAVQKTLERPTSFTPVPIEAVLERGLQEKTGELRGLERERDELVRTWPRTARADTASGARLAVYQGHAQVDGTLLRMIAQAKEEVILVGSKGGLHRLSNPAFMEAAKKRAEGGIGFRVITEADASNLDSLGAWAEFAQVRHLELSGYYQVIIVDNQEFGSFASLGKRVSTGGTEESLLWIASPDLVLGQKHVFDLLWPLAVDFEARRGELGDGPRAPRVQVLRGRTVRLNAMRELLRSARTHIDVVTSSVDQNRWARAGIDAILKKRESAGVKVSVRIDTPAPRGPGGRPECDHMLVNVDRQVLLAAYNVNEAPDELAFDHEWGVLVVLPGLADRIAHYVDVLSEPRLTTGPG